ncbi:MAG: lytic transglycosylase F [Desulfobacteraceae bacterium 4572_130]|nr:MAG: lytic transglycosylase F [Desulfobacteraceae bacterium 4572_130]
MKKNIYNSLFCFIVAVFLPIIIYIYLQHNPLFVPSKTLIRIKKNKILKVITHNNFNSYYIYREKPMGFEYDIAKEFAKFLNVELKVINPGWNNMFSFLEKNKGDFIAAGFTITNKRKEKFDFSRPYMEIQQRLIHHKLIIIENLKQLAGKKIHVRKKTSYHASLEQIKNTGIDFEIILYDNIPTEDLIRKVAEKKIKYTVADSNIAMLNRRYYPDIILGIPLEKKEKLAWAVNKNNKKFLKKMNTFLKTAETNGIYKKIYEKYYSDIDYFDYFDLKKFHERINTRLPQYKKTIIAESKKYNFDWRIIAALIYQESHYDPMAESFKGAMGLMQLTTGTALEMNINDRLDPEQSIKAGIKYLNKMYKNFKELKDNDEQKLIFAIASYNIGYGHIRDAQKIALDKEMDKNKWSCIEKTLPLLSKPEYHENTKYGYARGTETVQYIERIFTYYDILKQKSQN